MYIKPMLMEPTPKALDQAPMNTSITDKLLLHSANCNSFIVFLHFEIFGAVIFFVCTAYFKVPSTLELRFSKPSSY